MSVSGISGSGFDSSSQERAGHVGAAGGDFAASLALSIANLKSQTLGSLLGPAADGGSRPVNPLAASPGTSPLPPAGGGISGLSAAGCNLSLFDPESAYKMMSVINKADVDYKAQFSELGEMKDYIATLEQAARQLGSTASSLGDGGIESRLQAFAGQYNAWVKRFDADMQQGGGILANTQAAQVARYELDQSIKNIFNGAKDGLRGLADLGFGIDPSSGLASLDAGKLRTALAANRPGVADALQDFSASFAKSANLLESKGNFIQNRLDNLGGAIHFIAGNKASLQNEFGTGDAAQPTGQVAQALAAYKRTYGA